MDRKARWLEDLGRLLESGLLPAQALRELLARPQTKAHRRALESAVAVVEAGRSMCEALAEPGLELGATDLAALEAGERAGVLPRTLARLAQRFERRHRLRRNLWQRLAYPLLLLHMVALVFAIVWNLRSGSLLAVLPRAALLAALLDGTLLLGWWFVRTRLQRTRSLDRLPLLGPLLRAVWQADYLDGIAVLHGAGLPLQPSHDLASRSLERAVLRDGLRPVAVALAAGESLAHGHRQAAALDAEIIAALDTGERTGQLEETAARLATTLGDRANHLGERAARITGQVVYAAAVFAVAWAVFSFYSRLYSFR